MVVALAQHVQAAIAEPATLLGKGLQPIPQDAIVRVGRPLISGVDDRTRRLAALAEWRAFAV